MTELIKPISAAAITSFSNFLQSSTDKLSYFDFIVMYSQLI